jgi:polyisoprenoid-binding protein YceI
MPRAWAAIATFLCLSSAYAADTYTIEPGHTSVMFAFHHFGLSTFHGKFTKAKGAVTLDQAQRKGSADITIDASAIVTGVPKLDEHLRSEDFFEVEKYPTIAFKSQDFVFKGDTLAEVRGNLTVRGITKPVTLKVTSFVCKEHPLMKAPACGADATATVQRSDFGLTAYLPGVSDEITLTIEVEAVRK